VKCICKYKDFPWQTNSQMLDLELRSKIVKGRQKMQKRYTLFNFFLKCERKKIRLNILVQLCGNKAIFTKRYKWFGDK
jgi:hypothetical protein